MHSLLEVRLLGKLVQPDRAGARRSAVWPPAAISIAAPPSHKIIRGTGLHSQFSSGPFHSQFSSGPTRAHDITHLARFHTRFSVGRGRALGP